MLRRTKTCRAGIGPAFFLKRENLGDFLEGNGWNDVAHSNGTHVFGHLVVGIAHVARGQKDVFVAFLLFAFVFIEGGECNFYFEPQIGIVETDHLREIALCDLSDFKGTNAFIFTNGGHPSFSFGVVECIQYKCFSCLNLRSFAVVASVLYFAGKPVLRHVSKVRCCPFNGGGFLHKNSLHKRPGWFLLSKAAAYLAGVKLKDDYQHKGKRKKLLSELRKMGISSEEVLEAMDRVPRHFFLSSAFDRYAYVNQAFQIGAGQTISKPFTVARQTELLQCTRGAKVLEIGTGSGYQCAVLCAMGYKVHSIERQKELFDKAGPLLREMGWRPELYYGDGYQGKSVFAPFDGIIVTCGAPEVPEALLGQLAIGGKLVIPVGDGDGQSMLSITRNALSEFTQQEHGEFAFVPMLSSRAPKR